MTQNRLTFESENLQVDWISFKFQYLDNPTMMPIAKYLFKIGFNSYQECGKLAQPTKEPILVNSKNKKCPSLIKRKTLFYNSISTNIGRVRFDKI